MPDLLHLGLPAFTRGSTRFESTVFAFGLTCLGSLSFLFVADNTFVGPMPLIQSLARSDPQSLILDRAHLGFALFVQSCNRTDPVPPAFSSTRLGPTLFVSDFTQLDLPPSSQGMAELELPSPAFDLLHLGSPALLHSFACSGSLAFTFGMSRPGFLSSMPVVDAVKLGFLLSLRSLVCSGLVVLVLDPLRLGPFLLLHTYACLDSSFPAVGVTSVGLLLLLPVVGIATFGLMLSVHNFAWLDLTVLVPDFLHPGLSISFKSFACVDLVVPASDSLHLGPPLFFRSFAQPEFAASISGMSCSGLVSSLSVVSSGYPDFLLFLQSCFRLGPLLLALDFLHIDLSSSLQSFAHSGSTSSLFGATCLDSTLLALDSALLEPVVPLRSHAQLGFAPSTLCATRISSLSSLHSHT